jgi:hypothetical protein
MRHSLLPGACCQHVCNTGFLQGDDMLQAAGREGCMGGCEAGIGPGVTSLFWPGGGSGLHALRAHAGPAGQVRPGL